MTNTSWTKDKDAISRWITNIMGVILIAIATGIYNKMENFTQYAIESKKDTEYMKKDIDFLKETDRTHQQHLEQIDELLYLKPEEVRIKFNPKFK